jgi:hypothetical protein
MEPKSRHRWEINSQQTSWFNEGECSRPTNLLLSGQSPQSEVVSEETSIESGHHSSGNKPILPIETATNPAPSEAAGCDVRNILSRNSTSSFTPPIKIHSTLPKKFALSIH